MKVRYLSAGDPVVDRCIGRPRGGAQVRAATGLSETQFSSGDYRIMSNFLPVSEIDTDRFIAHGIRLKDQNFRWCTQHGNK
jgi:hypothetical protein